MIGKAIHTLLAESTEVTDLMGENFYPIIVPQNTEFPAITYKITNSEAMEVKGFQKIADTVSVQLGVFAATYNEMATIAEAVKATLDYQQGLTVNEIDIDWIVKENEMDSYDEDLNLYQRILKYEISINQPYTL